MKKTHLYLSSLLIFFISFAQNSFAQDNWVSGYIVTQSKDTTRGQINQSEWDKNPNSIKFRVKEDLPYKQFTYSDIISFVMAERNFISAKVQSEISPFQKGELSEDPELQLKERNVFLEILIKGDKSLFQFIDEKGRPNFYIEKDQSIELLHYKKYFTWHTSLEQGTIKQEKENKKYTRQLMVYFENCPSLLNKSRTASYEKNSLIDLFNSYYNRCSKSKANFKSERDKPISIEKGVILGMSLTTIDFTQDDNGLSSLKYEALTNASFKSSTNFSGGILINIHFSKKLAINNDILYSSFTSEGEYTTSPSLTGGTTYTKMKVGASHVKINNALDYNILSNKSPWRISLNLGLSNSFLLSQENEQVQITRQSTNGLETTKEGKVLDMQNHEVGFILGLRLKKRNYSFLLRHERSDGISHLAAVGSPTSRFYFLFGYSF